MFSYGLDKDKKWAYEEKYKIFKVSKDSVWENQNCELGTIVF